MGTVFVDNLEPQSGTTLTLGASGDAINLASGATAGFGKIGQVLSTNKLDTFSTTSTSFTDITNLSVNITPSSTSSKIYVIAFVSAGTGNTSADNKLRVARDSTNIPPSAATVLTRITSSDLNVTNTMSFLDSPSTTSQITYKVQAKAETGTFYVNRNGAGNNEGYSSITVMEVLA